MRARVRIVPTGRPSGRIGSHQGASSLSECVDKHNMFVLHSIKVVRMYVIHTCMLIYLYALPIYADMHCVVHKRKRVELPINSSIHGFHTLLPHAQHSIQ